MEITLKVIAISWSLPHQKSLVFLANIWETRAKSANWIIPACQPPELFGSVETP